MYVWIPIPTLPRTQILGTTDLNTPRLHFPERRYVGRGTFPAVPEHVKRKD